VISDVYEHHLAGDGDEIHHFQLSDQLLKRKKKKRSLEQPLASTYNFSTFTTANTTEGLISRARALALLIQLSYPERPDLGEEFMQVYEQGEQKSKDANFTSNNLFKGTRESKDDRNTIGVQVVVL